MEVPLPHASRGRMSRQTLPLGRNRGLNGQPRPGPGVHRYQAHALDEVSHAQWTGVTRAAFSRHYVAWTRHVVPQYFERVLSYEDPPALRTCPTNDQGSATKRHKCSGA